MIDLAIIPARAGSMGLPGKNTADLAGRPLISWTVRAACASGVFSRVIVSTDGEDIAEASIAAGAEIPFLRPADLATAEARSIDVVTHALSECGEVGSFALLQPTSPFRNAQHLRSAADLFTESTEAVVSITKAKPLAWHFERDDHGRLSPAISQMVHRRQDAAQSWTPNGAIYLCQTTVFCESGSLFPKGALGFPMSQVASIDIDDAEDLSLARAVAAGGLAEIDP